LIYYYGNDSNPRIGRNTVILEKEEKTKEEKEEKIKTKPEYL
jgi:hypothetical protein